MRWKTYLMIFLLVVFAQEVRTDNKLTIVVIKGFQFSAQEITIKRGTTVRWENQEQRQYHNVWFEASGEEEPDYLFPDEFYERVFDEVGSFPYRCGPHPKMTGIVHVIE